MLMRSLTIAVVAVLQLVQYLRCCASHSRDGDKRGKANDSADGYSSCYISLFLWKSCNHL